VSSSIAFAIPYYRGLSYLEEALRSLQAQTFEDWEAVIVDDLGPESAEKLVAGLSDPRIRYLRNETNLGLAANWNRAIERTTAPLVTVFHCDDVLEPNYAETMVRLMRENPSAIAGHCRTHLIDEDGKATRTLADSAKRVIRPSTKGTVRTEGDEGLASLLRGFWIFCPTLCYRRDAFRVRNFDSRLKFVADFDFLSHLLLSGETVVGTSVVGYRYRRHSQNETAKMTGSLERFDEEFCLYGNVMRQSAQAGWKRSEITARRALILRAHLGVVAIQSLLRLNLGRTRRALMLSIRRLGD
jgi:glycosyltransferase involved in cell wall biosynthesis